MAEKRLMPSRDSDCRWRDYIRMPDRTFWAGLFAEPPVPGERDALRRARLSRYGIGLTTVLTLAYLVGPVLATDLWVSELVWTNGAALVAYLFAMWMASLGRSDLARHVFIVSAEAQVLVLVALTGDSLNMFAFTFAIATLARAMFSPREPVRRFLFVAVPVVTLLLAATLLREPLVQFPEGTALQLAFVRVLNLVTCLICVLLVLTLFEREVLLSEADLTAARERSDRLLRATLPESIVDRLRRGEEHIADSHAEVTVLFADISGFTPWAAEKSPDQVVAMLERIFSRFDQAVEAAGAEKIKTIGDAYMAVSGAPESREDHAEVVARLALDMLAVVARINREQGTRLALRVGIHSGPVVAGVIGKLRFSYDVWGDTVNTASRMESHGEPGRIQISESTYCRLGDDFVCEHRGHSDFKGKGAMVSWWLLPSRGELN